MESAINALNTLVTTCAQHPVGAALAIGLLAASAYLCYLLL
ncbi:hypothetical protein [Aliikangiella coralliicola]|nr:hypothetical protein [Aliikangiella coralliicola]